MCTLHQEMSQKEFRFLMLWKWLLSKCASAFNICPVCTWTSHDYLLCLYIHTYLRTYVCMSLCTSVMVSTLESMKWNTSGHYTISSMCTLKLQSSLHLHMYTKSSLIYVHTYTHTGQVCLALWYFLIKNTLINKEWHKFFSCRRLPLVITITQVCCQKEGTKQWSTNRYINIQVWGCALCST